MPISFSDGTVLPNPKKVLTHYCSAMGLGRRYEAWVHSDENLKQPNRLLYENWKAAHWVHARGMSWKSMEEYFSDERDSPLPLSAISPDADLVNDWPILRSAVHALLVPLLRKRGVAAANATKLLYQKRPGLIPILDSAVCARLAGCWDMKEADDVVDAIGKLRESMCGDGNLAELRRLKEWIRNAENVSLCPEARARISLMRLYDIVAWDSSD
jgi:hypothetical protein